MPLFSFLRPLRTFCRMKSDAQNMVIRGSLLVIPMYFKEKKVRYGQHIRLDFLPDKIELNESQAQYVKAVRQAIRIIKKYHFLPIVCRHESRLAAWFFARKNIPYSVFIGFKQGEKGMEGHAWTMVGSRMVTGNCNPSTYTIINRFSNFLPPNAQVPSTSTASG